MEHDVPVSDDDREWDAGYADSGASGALSDEAEGSYQWGMVNESDTGLTRRELLRAGALLGMAAFAHGCMTTGVTEVAAAPSENRRRDMTFDVVIIGGGPAGLAAALALGRARKSVLLCDAGPRRNAAAVHMHNFVTRDGTPPEVFRQIGREQLAHYPNVEIRDVKVLGVTGVSGAFRVEVEGAQVEARRIIVCTGMIDEGLPIEGFEALWGHAIFQCPYCHGWEVRDRQWGYLARGPEGLDFGLFLRGWTDQVTVFTGASFEVPAGAAERLHAGGVVLETRPIARLEAQGRALVGVLLEDGARVPCEFLYVHGPQRHVEVVRQLGLALDRDGYVVVDAMTRQSSVPGIYAAGDLTTRAQGAIYAASMGTQAAGMVNHDLTMETVRAQASR